MNTIKFKSEFLTLDPNDNTGVYDQEIDGVTTIINFDYKITHYDIEDNECEVEVYVTEATQFINEGTFEKHIKLMKSELNDLDMLVFDEVNSDPSYMVQYIDERAEYYNEF